MSLECPFEHLSANPDRRCVSRRGRSIHPPRAWISFVPLRRAVAFENASLSFPACRPDDKDPLDFEFRAKELSCHGVLNSGARKATRHHRSPRNVVSVRVAEWQSSSCQSVGARDHTRLPPPSGARFPVGSSRARASPPNPRTSRACRSPPEIWRKVLYHSHLADARPWSSPRVAMTVAAEGATKVVKPESASMPSAPAPANGAAPGVGDVPAANPADYAQWAAAAAMQSYYAGANAKAPAGASNGQQAAAYYAQMAQQPHLYAQMWANPVRSAPRPRHSCAFPRVSERTTLFPGGTCRRMHRASTSSAERPPRGAFRLIFHSKTVSQILFDFGVFDVFLHPHPPAALD